MAANSSVIASLLTGPVPADLQCPKSMQDIVDTVCQVATIGGLASQIGGSGVVPTNNIAQQALTTAQQALSLAQTNANDLPKMRGSTAPIALTAGASNVPIIFNDVGTTNYSVIITFEGPYHDPASNFNYNIITGSKTSNSFQIGFYAVPAGWSFSWQLITLTNTST